MDFEASRVTVPIVSIPETCVCTDEASPYFSETLGRDPDEVSFDNVSEPSASLSTTKITEANDDSEAEDGTVDATSVEMSTTSDECDGDDAEPFFQTNAGAAMDAPTKDARTVVIAVNFIANC
mmetsp:Transcript_7921/g.11305  ORF Transcript_7921/g.11305 Transcript_7921/m.11305 type:complete len:123 (-) Transcript_7921:70-438(-)